MLHPPHPPRLFVLSYSIRLKKRMSRNTAILNVKHAAVSCTRACQKYNVRKPVQQSCANPHKHSNHGTFVMMSSTPGICTYSSMVMDGPRVGGGFPPYCTKLVSPHHRLRLRLQSPTPSPSVKDASSKSLAFRDRNVTKT